MTSSPPENGNAQRGQTAQTSQVEKYLVTYVLDSRLIVDSSSPLLFNLPDEISVKIAGLHVGSEGADIEAGLFASVKLAASSIEEAISRGEVSLQWIIDTLVMSHSAFIGNPVWHTAVELVPGIADRAFAQRVSYELVSGPKRKFTRSRFDAFWARLMPVQQADRPRIGRAISWYRKAVAEDNVLDQFVNLYTGLEVINELVKRKNNLVDARTVRKCPECGADVVTQPTHAGISFIINKLLCKPMSDFTAARHVRIGLLHGYEELGDLTRQAFACLPALKDALAVGILHLLNVPPAEWPLLVRASLSLGIEPHAIVKATLRGVDCEELLSGKATPYLDVTHTRTGAVKKQGDKLTESGTFLLKLEGAGRAQLINVQTRILAPKDPEDGSGEANVTMRIESPPGGAPSRTSGLE